MRLFIFPSRAQTCFRRNMQVLRTYNFKSQVKFEDHDFLNSGVTDYTDPPINPHEKEMLTQVNNESNSCFLFNPCRKKCLLWALR